MKNKILVTGATGNVGQEVVKNLLKKGVNVKVAVTNIESAKKIFSDSVEYVQMEFGKEEMYDGALKDVQKVFLMRPPAISDVKKYIFPFVDVMLDKNIEHVAFLSLQGADVNFFAPHAKVEKYMKKKGIPYTFLRPSFFMQNLSTTHRKQIAELDKIIVPAGNGKTSFVDARDIGVAAAICLTEDAHKNKAYTLTGTEALTYYQIAEILSKVLERKIEYTNPSGKEFVEEMKREGFQEDMINVMKVIYFIAKLGLAGGLSDELEKLIGQTPVSFEQFAQDYKDCWEK